MDREDAERDESAQLAALYHRAGELAEEVRLVGERIEALERSLRLAARRSRLQESPELATATVARLKDAIAAEERLDHAWPQPPEAMK